jgi:hypothetical protein
LDHGSWNGTILHFVFREKFVFSFNSLVPFFHGFNFCRFRRKEKKLTIQKAISTTKQIEETVDIIAKFVVKYNCTKTYEAKETSGGKNCQSFVEELLTELGVTKNFGHSVG